MTSLPANQQRQYWLIMQPDGFVFYPGHITENTPGTDAYRLAFEQNNP